MCYSAQVQHHLKTLGRRLGARIDTPAFARLFRHRLENPSIRIPKALEANFSTPETEPERVAWQAILRYRERCRSEWQAELFAQKKRLADAQRSLQKKDTKKAREDVRIATAKSERYLGWLQDLDRAELERRDSRIYPMSFAPVIVVDGDELVIRPMRYHCRPADKPASYDKRFDGLYNARRDNLEGFWRKLWGQHHALVVMNSFYENVALHDYEKRELRPGEQIQNLVLHFNPAPATDMLVACVWDRWAREGELELLSFAAITDEPPPEIAATGHERCVIPMREENIRRWLTPGGRSLEELYQVLDDRERPYYEHRVAA